jgi:glutamate-5-semialdehyde dehydrogenase
MQGVGAMSEIVLAQARRAREAARALGTLGTDTKNAALLAMADALMAQAPALIAANAADVAAGRERGLTDALIDRLTLNEKRLQAMAEGLRQIAALPDPVGQVIDGGRRPNGLEIQRVRVPLGVVGIIYESRPNVTADAAALCVKAGNAAILRGGSEAIRSNTALARLLASAGERAGLPENSIQLIETTDRESALALMRAEGLVDVLIPRGGEQLKKSVLENATVPVLTSLGGNCHTYVDAGADRKMAADIAFNAKVSRPSVCNAMETLLVHADVAETLLPALGARLEKAGVEIRGCERTRQWIPTATPATEEDWATEYLALILAVRVVDSLDAAIDHIARYGTGHSEAIVTGDYAHAERFTREVDAACVFVNASTRFTDGFEFGKGAEVGISTQKLHARGPIGLAELTTYKTIVRGSGQIRC